MRKRNNQITIRLHPKHYKKLQKKAASENVNISEFIRKTIMRAEFYDLPDDDYAEMKQQVKEIYLEIKKIEFNLSYKRCLPTEILEKSLEYNIQIRDIIKHYHKRQDALGNSKKMPKWYKWTNNKRIENRLCIRFNDEEREKLDKLLTRTFVSQNTVIQRLCLGELIPIKKPEAYYDTLRYINDIGWIRLMSLYRYAEDSKIAWDKICDIQDVRDDAMRLIRDFI